MPPETVDANRTRLLALFRVIALVEGLTTIFLFLVAMPMKYFAGVPFLITPVGWIHGMAFIAYVVTALVVLPFFCVGPTSYLRTFAASVVPFGTFLNDRYIANLKK